MIEKNPSDLSREYQAVFKNRSRRRMALSAKKVVALGGALITAQALHIHPEAIQAIPQALQGGAEFVYNAANLLHNTSEVVGNVLENLPLVGGLIGLLPHMVETHTSAHLLTQPTLTTLEVVGGVETVNVLRNTSKQRKNRKRFDSQQEDIEEASEATANNQIGVPLLQRQEKKTIYGNPLNNARKALKNPFDKLNAARIVHSLQENLLETREKEMDWKKKYVNKRTTSLFTGEAVEQTAKAIGHHATHHAGKLAIEHGAKGVLLGFAGVFAWAGSHLLTEREIRKTGAKELRKASFLQLPGAFLPVVAGLVYALWGVYQDVKAQKQIDKTQKYVVAGLAHILRNENPNTAVYQSLKQLAEDAILDDKAREEMKKLPETLGELHREFDQMKQTQERVTNFNKEQLERNKAIKNAVRLDNSGWITRSRNRKKIERLDQEVLQRGNALLELRHTALEGDIEVQVAEALNQIYAPYLRSN